MFEAAVAAVATLLRITVKLAILHSLVSSWMEIEKAPMAAGRLHKAYRMSEMPGTPFLLQTKKRVQQAY